jgi:hypothetical protein
MTHRPHDGKNEQHHAKDDVTQPEPDSSSDGDGSWTDDPITADPDEDRSVDAVIERQSRT